MTNLPQSNDRWIDPTTLSANAAFFLLATLFLAIVGWLMQIGILPSFAENALSQRYSPWGTRIPLKTWMQLAVVVSLILPVFALLVGWRCVAALVL